MDYRELKLRSGKDCKVPENLPSDMADANLLMKDYGGKVSETSAIMQYIYQHYTASLIDKDIADVLRRISLVEMHHHELLGTAIANLGGDPIIGADYKYWTAGYINYTRDLREMLTVDIGDEKKAIFNYEKTIQMLNNQDVAKMIMCIIEDEKVHIEALTSLIATLP